MEPLEQFAEELVEEGFEDTTDDAVAALQDMGVDEDELVALGLISEDEL